MNELRYAENREQVKIFDIIFYNGTVDKVIEYLKCNGGLLVVPAAPALVNIKKDALYYEALLNADMVIPDSGYMVLIWNLINQNKLNRISGLEFLKSFFTDREIILSNSIFLINPTSAESAYNSEYLKKMGIQYQEDFFYNAPFYKNDLIEDVDLLDLVNKKRPKYIVINLGGGVQEKLGLYLKRNLKYKPAIICTGAAIAFLTGRQARIPDWGDRFYLGWLFRCMQNPKLYIPRYMKAFKLAWLLTKNKYIY